MKIVIYRVNRIRLKTNRIFYDRIVIDPYIHSKPVRQEKAASARSLGEVIKTHRISCNMTQEFVAEAIGVSRQAVSKWESGASDPSTTNFIALTKLFGIEAEDLLRETR